MSTLTPIYMDFPQGATGSTEEMQQGDTLSQMLFAKKEEHKSDIYDIYSLIMYSLTLQMLW